MPDPKTPFRFQGYPGYLARVSADDSTDVVGMAQSQPAMADTADLLSQCADADPTHRKGILEAAKLRARAAEIASETCKAMVADIEANFEFPDVPARILLTPGPEAGFRKTAPTKNAVISEVTTPGEPGQPPDRHTIGPEATDRKNPDDGTSQPLTPGGGEHPSKPAEPRPADATPAVSKPAIVDHREGQEERFVSTEPAPEHTRRRGNR